MNISSNRTSKAKFQKILIEQMRDQLCWQMGKYLGSMLTFDFGGQVPTRTRLGSDVVLGTATLGVRNCYWELRKNTAIIEDSELVTDDTAEDMFQYFENAYLEDIDFLRASGRVELIFSNQTCLSIDITNKWKTEGAILRFDLPDEKICEISPKAIVSIRLE